MKKKTIWITVVALIVVGSAIAVAYNIRRNNPNVGVDEPTPSETQEKETEQPISLSVNDGLAKELYSYICKEANFYRGKLIKHSDLSNKEKILTICIAIDDGSRTVISKQEFDEKLHQIFGDSVSVKHETAWINNIIGGYDFENDGFIINNGGAGGISSREYTKLTRAERVGDNIYLYDRYVLAYGDGPEEGLYGDVGASIKIHEKKTEQDKSMWIGFNATQNEIDFFIEKFGDKIPEYKHTFSRAIDGNYRWVSSEIVD